MSRAPNTSAAVMAQRAEPADSLDDFPTPPWAGRALCDMLDRRGVPLHTQHAWEPACNRGHLVRGLRDGFAAVYASDIADYGWPGMDAQFDFLMRWPAGDLPDADWIVTNPPFRLAEEFVRLALDRARVGVAMFVRVAFLEGVGRYRRLFRGRPPAFVLPFTERVVLHRSVLRQAGERYWDAGAGEAGAWKTASTATAYAWVVWLVEAVEVETLLIPIPPCRARMERAGDYGPTETDDAAGIDLPLIRAAGL